MTIAVALVAVLFNTVLVKQLPAFEFFVLIAHIAAYVEFEVVFIVMDPRSSRQDVFGTYENEYGWPSMSTAVLIGWYSVCLLSIKLLTESRHYRTRNYPHER